MSDDVTHHVNHPQLNCGFGVQRLDHLGEALQTIHAGDEDVLHATVLELSHQLQTELGTFRLRNPQAQ